MTIRPSIAALKLTLAARGVRLDPSARGLSRDPAQRLDLVLPGGVRVSAPTSADEHTPWRLGMEDEGYFVTDDAEDAARRIAVRPVSSPRFALRETSRGFPMARVATVHGTHLLVHPTMACGWSAAGAPCRFCLEGARSTVAGDGVASVSDVIDVVRAAFEEGAAESVWFNTDAFDAEDGGLAFLAPYVDAVRKHFDTAIAVQVHPPRNDEWIDHAYAMGVDALSYNLELFDADELRRRCVGRDRYIGRDRYLAALARAAQVFPSGTVWCDLVVGAEPLEATLAGIDALASMGVVPVLAARWQPGEPALDAAVVATALEHLYRRVKEHRISMSWVRDLALGVAPVEAREAAGDAAGLAGAVESLSRSRLGGLAARSLARFRRRLRVRRISESFDSSHL